MIKVLDGTSSPDQCGVIDQICLPSCSSLHGKSRQSTQNACFHNTRPRAVKSSAPWKPGNRQGAPSLSSLPTQCSHCLISGVRVLSLKLGIFFSLTRLSSLWEQRLPLLDSTPLVYSIVAMYWLPNRHLARSEPMGCSIYVHCRLCSLSPHYTDEGAWPGSAVTCQSHMAPHW